MTPAVGQESPAVADAREAAAEPPADDAGDARAIPVVPARRVLPPRLDADGRPRAPAAKKSAAADASAAADEPPADLPARSDREPSWVDRAEAFLSRLSTRDNFWHRIFSLLFLPLAFWSGIKMRKTGDREVGDEGGSFAAILPFTKFNKNWYNAMAGASLLANTEIAGGMYVFGEAGGDYTVVCKNLNYTFLRPCYGPAVYRAEPRENLKTLIAEGGEFNITLDMDIRQLGVKPGEREKRVGRAEITFHVTPKGHAKVRQKKLKQRDKQRAQLHRGRG